MSVSEILDGLRKNLPGCSVVALGDLSSQIVLCVSVQEQQPQEFLDQLCLSATALFGDRFAGPTGEALGREPDEAIIMTADQTQVFIRSPNGDSDVLCCVFPKNVDITQVSGRVRTTFAELAARA